MKWDSYNADIEAGADVDSTHESLLMANTSAELHLIRETSKQKHPCLT